MKCENCVWFNLIVLKIAKEDKEFRECRKKCPELTLKDSEEQCCVWPSVQKDDWCGDFYEKKP